MPATMMRPGAPAAAAAGGGAPNTQPPAFNLDTFLTLMQPQRYRVGSKPYVDGGLVTFILPQTGAASKLMVFISGTITVAGTISSGTFQGLPFPAPLSIVRGLSLTSNQNLQTINLSGWGWYKWVRQRCGIDPFSQPAAFFSPLYSALEGVQAPSIVPGANVTARTYNVAWMLPIPLAYNDELLTGLIALASNSINYPLSFQMGNITGGISATGGTNDVFNALVGTGITVTANLQITVDAEIIKINPNYPPLTSMVMSIAEFNQTLMPGINTINLPPNDIYTMVMIEATNNGAAVNPGTIAEAVWKYSGNNIRYDEDIPTKVGFDFWKGAPVPTDGTIIWDLGTRKGLIHKRDLYDGFNDSQVTQLQVLATLPIGLTVTAPAQWEIITEALRYVKQRQ